MYIDALMNNNIAGTYCSSVKDTLAAAARVDYHQAIAHVLLILTANGSITSCLVVLNKVTAVLGFVPHDWFQLVNVPFCVDANVPS